MNAVSHFDEFSMCLKCFKLIEKIMLVQENILRVKLTG